MIYRTRSMVDLTRCVRYGLLCLRPFMSLRRICGSYLESPDTNSYSVAEERRLFPTFSEVRIQTESGHCDLIATQVGQRHRGA